MKIGIPKEIKNNENRVGMTPAGVSELVKHGHEVYVQATAGLGSGFTDEMYIGVGANILPTIEDVYRISEMIVKVKEPIKPEYDLIRNGQLVFTYFHFACSRELTEAMVKSGGVCLAFVLLVLAFINPISEWMHYEGHSEYIWPMAIVAALDAFQCIPFAYLRYSRKALKFAMLKCLFIVLNIVLNLMYFIAVPMLYENESTRHIVSSFFDGQVRVEWIFYINLICTSLVTFFFRKELTGFKYVFDARLAKRMLNYSWPILVFGIAGILNQTADKLIFPFVSSHAGKEVNVQLGIYGACVKIAMIMTLFTQAFRYAYEPFVFGKSKEKNSRMRLSRHHQAHCHCA